VTGEQVVASELADIVRRRAAGAHRYLFGITGAPGSGKSTLAATIADELNAPVVAMDGFHLSNAVLNAQGWRDVKGAPQTFAAADFVAALRCLRQSHRAVSLPDFDRTIGDPRANRIFVPASARIVIVEGNYLLLDTAPWDELREIFDAVAHLAVDPVIRVERLVERHVRFGKTRRDASLFVQRSDEANAAVIEAVSHRAHLIVQTDK
jgi:pantothenate kinase